MIKTLLKTCEGKVWQEKECCLPVNIGIADKDTMLTAWNMGFFFISCYQWIAQFKIRLCFKNRKFLAVNEKYSRGTNAQNTGCSSNLLAVPP
jgi:hypothetical protein